jgi:hypothetical protein
VEGQWLDGRRATVSTDETKKIALEGLDVTLTLIAARAPAAPPARRRLLPRTVSRNPDHSSED